jgi:hypothetical protein
MHARAYTDFYAQKFGIDVRQQAQLHDSNNLRTSLALLLLYWHASQHAWRAILCLRLDTLCAVAAPGYSWVNVRMA